MIFKQNYQDYKKFLEFNLKISENYHAKNINQEDSINSDKSAKGIDKLIDNFQMKSLKMSSLE